MTERLSVYLSLLAVWIGEDLRGAPTKTRRALLTGLLFGLAGSLRYQFAPALGLAILAQHWRDRRSLVLIAVSGIAVGLIVFGGLDILTWGHPFQSLWLNYSFNAQHGISNVFGTDDWSTYLRYYLVSWGVLSSLILLAVIYGATQAPTLAVLVIATISMHSMIPHKEARFVFLATACLPILTGLGVAGIRDRFRRYLSQDRILTSIALALVVSMSTALATDRFASKPDDWHRGRSMLKAIAEARTHPDVCGLAIRGWVYETGGYSYWHRDVPIYFETWDAAQTIGNSAVFLPLKSVLKSAPVPQYPGASLSANPDKFNVIIGLPTDGLPGFSKQGCYGSGLPDEKDFCVFVRPGGCG
jgi:hypothetical protein